jgi:ribosomal protein L37AE/L43A
MRRSGGSIEVLKVGCQIVLRTAVSTVHHAGTAKRSEPRCAVVDEYPVRRWGGLEALASPLGNTAQKADHLVMQRGAGNFLVLGIDLDLVLTMESAEQRYNAIRDLTIRSVTAHACWHCNAGSRQARGDAHHWVCKCCHSLGGGCASNQVNASARKVSQTPFMLRVRYASFTISELAQSVNTISSWRCNSHSSYSFSSSA